MTRQLIAALALGLLGLCGALPGERGPDALVCAGWVALIALPAGIASGALALRPWPFAAAVPALWMIELGVVTTLSERELPTPIWAALVWTGMYAAGFGLARAWTLEPLRAAALALVVVALLAGLPSLGARTGRAFPPWLSARLIDLSPLSVCLESAGVDWMRHPALYEPAGTLDIDPGMREPYRGRLAGPALLLVGCLLAAAGEWLARRRAGLQGPAAES